jgi:hypothetical protein
LQFVARNIPPLGYKTYTVSQRPAPHGNDREPDKRPLAADASAQRIENDFFRVTLDPARCGVRSILDKRTGRELVNPQSPYALGQYLYERFDADQVAEFTRDYVKSPTSGEMISHGKPNLPSAKEFPRCEATAANATLEIHENATSVAAVLKAAPHGNIPDATQLRVTLHAAAPWLDLEWSIPRKTPDPWPEAGWLCFPLRADDPTFRLARLGCIVDPAKDLVRGSNHEIFCLSGGLLVNGSEGGSTGICPIDSQLVSLEHRGLWRYSRDFVAHKPDVFVMLFNNLYSTNFPQWIEGTWSSRVRLWATEKGQPLEKSLIGGSWEARTPCLAAVCDAAPGKLPLSAAGLTISKGAEDPAGDPAARDSLRRRLLVTAFGPNPYGHGTLLRLWEQVGDAGTYTIRLPSGMNVRTAQPCDLRGQPIGQPLAVKDGAFQVQIESMAPMSVILGSANQ